MVAYGCYSHGCLTHYCQRSQNHNVTNVATSAHPSAFWIYTLLNPLSQVEHLKCSQSVWLFSCLTNSAVVMKAISHTFHCYLPALCLWLYAWLRSLLLLQPPHNGRIHSMLLPGDWTSVSPPFPYDLPRANSRSSLLYTPSNSLLPRTISRSSVPYTSSNSHLPRTISRSPIQYPAVEIERKRTLPRGVMAAQRNLPRGKMKPPTNWSQNCEKCHFLIILRTTLKKHMSNLHVLGPNELLVD